MDLPDLASRITSVLAPYLHQVATGLAQGADSAQAPAAKLLELLGQQIQHHSADLWRTLHESPPTPDTHQQLQEALTQLLAQDPALASQAKQIVESSAPAPSTTTTNSSFVITGSQLGNINQATAPGAVAGDGNIVGSNVQTTTIGKVIHKRGARFWIIVCAAAALLVGLVTSIVIVVGQGPGASAHGSSSGPTSKSNDQPLGTTPTGESPSPSSSPLASGTRLASAGDGYVQAWADGSTLAVMAGEQTGTPYTITTYNEKTGQQLASIPLRLPDGVTDGCVDKLVRRNDGLGIMLTDYNQYTPAKGVTPADSVEHLVAIDTTNGDQLWDAALPGYASDDDTTDAGGPCVGILLRDADDMIQASSDGRYVLDLNWSDAPYAIDLQTGTTYRRPNAFKMIGNWAATGAPSSDAAGEEPSSVSLVDPGTGATAGTISNAAAIDVLWRGMSDAHPVSPDGRRLYIVGGYNATVTAEAFNLPSGSVAWTVPFSGFDSQAPNWGDSLAVDDATGATFSAGTQGVLAFSNDSGKSLWNRSTRDGPTLCGATNGHVYIEVNGQFATLNETTGDQITYNPNISGCPAILNGVVAEKTSGDNEPVQMSFIVG